MVGLKDIAIGMAAGAAGGWANGIVERNRARAAAALAQMERDREDAQRQQDQAWDLEKMDYADKLKDGNRVSRGGGGGGGGRAAAGYRFLTMDEISQQGLDPGKVYQINEKTGSVSSKGNRAGAASAPAGASTLTDEEIAAAGLDPSKVYQRNPKTGKITASGDRATDESYASRIEEGVTAAGLPNLPTDVQARVNQRVRNGEKVEDVLADIETEEVETNPDSTMVGRFVNSLTGLPNPDDGTTEKRVKGIKDPAPIANVPDAPPAPPAAGTQPASNGPPKTTGNPQGPTTEEKAAALDNARSAIARGAPREAVLARLRAAGISTDGL